MSTGQSDFDRQSPTEGEFYEIRIMGHLDPSWSDWLGGLAIAPQTGDETLLTGLIVDQAALHGILDKLYAMNLSILSVVQVRND